MVLQAEVVADLVGDGLGDDEDVAELGGEDERRLVDAVVGVEVEDVQEGHAGALQLADGLRRRPFAGDQGGRAEDLVAGPGAVDRPGCRLLGGHVDVERCVVVGHPLPDRLDGGVLGGAEGAGVGVEGVAAQRGGGQALAVPLGPGDRGAVEVEVDRAPRARLAVQPEGLARRVEGPGSGRPVGGHGAGVAPVAVEDPAGRAEPDRLVLLQQRAQVVGRHVVERRGPGQARAQRVDGRTALGRCVQQPVTGRGLRRGRRGGRDDAGSGGERQHPGDGGGEGREQAAGTTRGTTLGGTHRSTVGRSVTGGPAIRLSPSQRSGPARRRAAPRRTTRRHAPRARRARPTGAR